MGKSPCLLVKCQFLLVNDFPCEFLLVNDPFHGYLIPLAGFKVSIKTPVLFQHNFSRFWDTWRAPLITFVYLHAPGAVQKMGENHQLIIMWRIIKKWSHVMSCLQLHQNLIDISNDRAKSTHQIEMCVCVFSFMFTSIASSKNRNDNIQWYMMIHDFSIFFWGLPTFHIPRLSTRACALLPNVRKTIQDMVPWSS